MKYGFGLRGVATVFVLASVPTLALAYIDPGNGAYMVQALMTVVAAGVFYLRHPVRTLKGIVRWLSGPFRRLDSAHEASNAKASMVTDEAAGSSRRSENS